VFGIYGIVREDSPPAVWIETSVEIAVLLVVYTAAACVLGLYVSLNATKNVTAVMYSVGLMILGCGITSMLVYAFVTNSGAEFGAFLAPFAPFTSIKFLVDPVELFTSRSEFVTGAVATRFAAVIGSVIAAGLYIVIIWRFYTSLVRNFDMTLRKQSGT